MVMEREMTVGEFVATTSILKRLMRTMHTMYEEIQTMIITDAILRMMAKLTDCREPWLPCDAGSTLKPMVQKEDPVPVSDNGDQAPENPTGVDDPS